MRQTQDKPYENQPGVYPGRESVEPLEPLEPGTHAPHAPITPLDPYELEETIYPRHLTDPTGAVTTTRSRRLRHQESQGKIPKNEKIKPLEFGNLPPNLLPALLRRKLQDSYFSFLQEFWSEIIPDPVKWNWHIPYLCAELSYMVERVGHYRPKLYDLVVNIPPGTTKSLACTVFLPAWAWTNYPFLKFIKTSHASTLSMEHAELTRAIVQSKKYQYLFPHIKIKRDNSAKSHFKIIHKINDNEIWKLGGGLFSTSVNAAVTGFHAHIKLTDDPLDPNKALSDTELKSCNQWLAQNLSSRNVDKKITPHIIIMQRVHRNDPSGMMLKDREKGKKVKHICLPGDVHSDGNRDRVSPKELLKYYDAQGGYLDPVRLDQDAIDEMEINLGQYGKKAQVDQNPTTPGAGMFQPQKINIISPMGYNFAANIRASVRSWDMAATEGGGAHTVGIKLSQLYNGRFLIEDLVRGQWGTDKREMIKEETTKMDGPNVTFLQEHEGGSGGKDQALATQRMIQALGNRCILKHPTGDKVFRADPLSVAINRGLFYMFEGPWNKEIIEEMMDFPNGKFKDIVDALAGAYNFFTQTKMAGTF